MTPPPLTSFFKSVPLYVYFRPNPARPDLWEILTRGTGFFMRWGPAASSRREDSSISLVSCSHVLAPMLYPVFYPEPFLRHIDPKSLLIKVGNIGHETLTIRCQRGQSSKSPKEILLDDDFDSVLSTVLHHPDPSIDLAHIPLPPSAFVSQSRSDVVVTSSSWSSHVDTSALYELPPPLPPAVVVAGGLPPPPETADDAAGGDNPSSGTGFTIAGYEVYDPSSLSGDDSSRNPSEEEEEEEDDDDTRLLRPFVTTGTLVQNPLLSLLRGSPSSSSSSSPPSSSHHPPPLKPLRYGSAVRLSPSQRLFGLVAGEPLPHGVCGAPVLGRVVGGGSGSGSGSGSGGSAEEWDNRLMAVVEGRVVGSLLGGGSVGAFVKADAIWEMRRRGGRGGEGRDSGDTTRQALGFTCRRGGSLTFLLLQTYYTIVKPASLLFSFLYSFIGFIGDYATHRRLSSLILLLLRLPPLTSNLRFRFRRPESNLDSRDARREEEDDTRDVRPPVRDPLEYVDLFPEVLAVVHTRVRSRRERQIKERAKRGVTLCRGMY